RRPSKDKARTAYAEVLGEGTAAHPQARPCAGSDFRRLFEDHLLVLVGFHTRGREVELVAFDIHAIILDIGAIVRRLERRVAHLLEPLIDARLLARFEGDAEMVEPGMH